MEYILDYFISVFQKAFKFVNSLKIKAITVPEFKMKKLLRADLAGKGLIAIFALFIIFHALILLRILPFDMVWGGQLKDYSSAIVYEGFAVFLLLLFIYLVWLKLKNLSHGRTNKFISITIWLIFAYFLLSIVANLASPNAVEKFVFMPISVIIAFLALRLAIEKA